MAQQTASNRENSPYSRYGIGEQRNGVNMLLRGMGSISSAYSHGAAINTDNPASYASLLLTTYEAGGEGSRRTITSGTNNYVTGMATLSYMSVGFPIGKHAGFAAGLRPVSRMYYQLNDTFTNEQLGRTTNIYFGDGAINYGFVGLAGRLGGFQAGVNFGYMFGTLRNSSVLETNDTLKVINSEFSRYTRIGDIYWKGGLLYEGRINSSLGFRLGGTLSISQGLSSTRDQFSIGRISIGGINFADTVQKVQGQRGDVLLPLSYSLGLQLRGKGNWMAGVDYSATNWDEYRAFGQMDSVGGQTYRLAFGAEFTPNPTSLYRYLQRVTYRLGFSYGTDYVRLRNTGMSFYSVTAGASLPFKRGTDRLHTALEFGRRGTQANGLIQENFVRLGVGFSLNDIWFKKRRYD